MARWDWHRSHSKLFLEKYRSCPAPVLLHNFVLSIFFRSTAALFHHCSAGANSITTEYYSPASTIPRLCTFTDGPTFFRAIKVLKVVAVAVLRGITFIPNLLCLLTLSRIRGRWGRWWRAHAHVHPGLHQSHSHSAAFFMDNFVHIYIYM